MPAENDERIYGLGIDTGGTFTDAAIVDMDEKTIFSKAKARTTYHDLSIGIAQAVDNVLNVSGFDSSNIGLVGVSTTLATNSILEGKGGRVGLIGIGWKPDPDWKLGTTKQVFISGGHDTRGEEVSPLILDEVLEAVSEMEGLDAVAVSGIFSVYNKSHERMVTENIRETLRVPVVMGHQLTTELGIHERTVTAVLNARLIPIINQFLNDVERSMKARGIKSQIMVFKGDGTLMNIRTARERPVETVLSGPAASSMGGRLLAAVDSCIIVDIGGTSTDIAFLEDGFPKVSKEGASVGEWRTRVRAVDMWTSALGGDSEIIAKMDGTVEITKNRVLPLSLAAARYEGLLERMRDTWETRFLVSFPRKDEKLTVEERRVLDFLSERGPSTPQEIREAAGIVLVERYVASLMQKNMVGGIGLTPTDLLHVRGDYIEGVVEAAQIGVEASAHMCSKSPAEFVESTINSFVARISEEVIKKIMMDERAVLPECMGCDFLLDNVTGRTNSNLLKLEAKVTRPIVGIGAPAHVWLPMIENRLGTKVIVPQGHEVGNAVGAVCSQVAETVDIVVFERNKRFILVSPFCDPITYYDPSIALRAAMKMAAEHVKVKAMRSGARDVRVKVETESKHVRSGFMSGSETTGWIEVRATAMGQPTIV
ncbi:MAG: hydantoinase/oxoprolinase family protein [Methanomassiliicoccales archaeon]|nr:hydantoinase/oxoprolinase family protein [Methanomassiliicoccales archaeon]NYT14954.1 hydantoinase/oxoprolinase family protein [Methanomassiliicoccales archaeon]